MKVMILGKYTIEIPQEQGKPITNKRFIGSPYAGYLKGRLSDISNESFIIEHITRLIAKEHKVNTIIEYFGGLGICSKIFQAILKPHRHIIIDWDTNCFETLRTNLGNLNGVELLNQNAMKYRLNDFVDLAFLDFDKFSVLHLDERADVNRWFNNIFRWSKYILISDSSIAKFHLNKQTYRDLFDKTINSFEDYLSCFSNYLFGLYGYHIGYCYHFSRCSFLLIARRYQSLQEMKKFNEKKHVKLIGSR